MLIQTHLRLFQKLTISHTTIRDDKDATRVRTDFDASAKVTQNSPSLNNVLHVGPSLIPKIVDILIRFRWYRVPLIGDIKKAFLNVRVDQRDRDCLRMLWVDNIHDDNPGIIVKRFTTAVFGMTSSQFLLGGGGGGGYSEASYVDL